MWFENPEFINLLEQWWNQISIKGSKMYSLVAKLKIIKNKALEWNKNNFNNIFTEKSTIEQEIVELNNEVIDKGMNECSYLKEKELMARYNVILLKEEIFWKHKLRETWLKEGDSNTKFFHNSTNFKRSVNRISKIKNGEGLLVENPEQVSESLVQFYQNLLNSNATYNPEAQNEMLRAIPNLILEVNNRMINDKLTLEEVKNVVFQMHPEKAPGPDGFQAGFFQKCWHFVGSEV